MKAEFSIVNYVKKILFASSSCIVKWLELTAGVLVAERSVVEKKEENLTKIKKTKREESIRTSHAKNNTKAFKEKLAWKAFNCARYVSPHAKTNNCLRDYVVLWMNVLQFYDYFRKYFTQRKKERAFRWNNQTVRI